MYMCTDIFEFAFYWYLAFGRLSDILSDARFIVTLCVVF